jgi:hypothetical protein
MKGKSGIHINPEHKGEFTAKAHHYGMTPAHYAQVVMNAPEGKYSPETRRQANFAKNAKNFHHGSK